MAYSLFDVVALVEDVPEDGLAVGMIGAVVDVYTEPTEAYEVEFCDSQGRTLALCALSSSQLRHAKQSEVAHE
jgi:hypothetical protein